MADSQDIEARLCDYIEGNLSPADQAEIERHLESHPRHREMIQELIRTRGLVGSLPQSKAPMDMTESLQSQLERSMLLGDGLNAAGDGRARHIWRTLVMAAVILLSISLGTAIFVMLHTASNNANFAPMVAATPAAPPSPPATMPAPVTLVMAEPTTQPVKLAPQTQPAVKQEMVATVDPSPATQPAAAAELAAATTQPSEPVLSPDQQADLAILANSIDSPATQPVIDPTTQPSTQPDDMDSSPDDSVAPDDDGQ
ncbi:MAG TPA: zf-HC2 domain-containing protein [Tepidisphaeraceae bacterium]|nr:zf-HC2 domain-containing protein [Tepidisphaeraceae bacterium]